MITGARAPRPAPSLVRYSDEDSAKGYDENPDDSDSLTEKPSEISSTDSQGGTESEQDSTGASTDPHSASFVNHYANVNSTFRHSQTWKRQKSSAVAVPTVPPLRHSHSIGAVAAAAAAAAPNNAIPQQLQLPQQNAQPQMPQQPSSSNNNPRGYSSFTDSDHGDASSAVVSLNGTQIVMNNMARSRAPLPGFSSFV